MTSRRKPHTPAAPRLDSAPDADELYPCTVDRLNREATARLNGTKVEPTPYDVLIDVISGPAHREAVNEAKQLCAQCPIFATCLRNNREEQWAKAILGLELLSKPKKREQCGTKYGAKLHRSNDERPCEDCRRANAEHTARYTASKTVAA